MAQKDYQNMPQIQEAALWERTAKSGLNYLSGTVSIEGQDYRITLFRNEQHESGDKRPAWSFKQNPQEQ